MTTEIEIFLDREKTKKVRDNQIDLGILEAGKKTDVSLFVENKIKFSINTEFTLDSEVLEAGNIDLKSSFDVIVPGQTKRIVLTLEPKITTLKPISAKLKVNLDYVVR